MIDRVPERWLMFYLALFLVLFIGCVMLAKAVITHSQIWHDVLLVISGLLLAGFFSIGAVMRAKRAMAEDDPED